MIFRLVSENGTANPTYLSYPGHEPPVTSLLFHGEQVTFWSDAQMKEQQHEVCQKYLCVAAKEDLSWPRERESRGLLALRQLLGISVREVGRSAVLW